MFAAFAPSTTGQFVEAADFDPQKISSFLDCQKWLHLPESSRGNCIASRLLLIFALVA